MASPLLQASISHYIAKRDKCLAELNVLLNNGVGTGAFASAITDEVIRLFGELDSADSTIRTIQVIIDGNEQDQKNKIADQLAYIHDLQDSRQKMTDNNHNQ